MNSTPKNQSSQTHYTFKSDQFWFFAIFKMAADAILIYENARRETFRDSLDMCSRHIQLPFHTFSTSYNFFLFDNWKNSNYLGLILETHNNCCHEYKSFGLVFGFLILNSSSVRFLRPHISDLEVFPFYFDRDCVRVSQNQDVMSCYLSTTDPTILALFQELMFHPGLS